ncbi:hypothetical protein [Pyrobaculum calidifontis]|uniref:Uncharacterized protein n=1 Tax=Pyrobaculum calidifontis (strain DSM 21063 / JCM 11548 / VA1) TaxID=410359 RepID=A3MTP7_PYRCJ|nr:hypothetical protein [Pyrobaculum calidifontis]ABO08014.1 conserved hypothetical protein [Pyrobaculum calidifontis JCM 11548]
MHRALLVIALFKFLVALVAFTITSRIDPVLLVSCVLMAISSIIVRVVEEGEVAIVLVGLILLIDSIGVLLSFTQVSILYVLTYIFFIVWDIQILMLFRQLIQ